VSIIYPRRHSRRRGYCVQLHLSVCLSVCLFVGALTGKRLELSTPNFVHVYSIAVTRHVLTQRSKVTWLRKPSWRTVASDRGLYSASQYAAVLPAAVAGVGLHVDTTAYVF